jgi:AcrR family transcriptional regulator
MTRSAPKSRPRNRDDTEARIVDAAATVLAREGLGGFGINAIAREAGADKVLVYRYFRDLDGLAEALGRRSDLWLGEAPAVPPDATYRDALWILFTAYLRTLRHSNFLRQALIVELSNSRALSEALARARSEAAQRWFRQAVGARTAPPGVDAPAINAIMVAALHHLALAASSGGAFAGLPLRTAKDWTRVEDAFHTLLAAAYPAKL